MFDCILTDFFLEILVESLVSFPIGLSSFVAALGKVSSFRAGPVIITGVTFLQLLDNLLISKPFPLCLLLWLSLLVWVLLLVLDGVLEEILNEERDTLRRCRILLVSLRTRLAPTPALLAPLPIILSIPRLHLFTDSLLKDSPGRVRASSSHS